MGLAIAVNEPCPPDAGISMDAGFTEYVQEFEFWLITTEAPAVAGLTEIEMLPLRGDEEVFAVPLKGIVTVAVLGRSGRGLYSHPGSIGDAETPGTPGTCEIQCDSTTEGCGWCKQRWTHAG